MANYLSFLYNVKPFVSSCVSFIKGFASYSSSVFKGIYYLLSNPVSSILLIVCSVFACKFFLTKGMNSHPEPKNSSNVVNVLIEKDYQDQNQKYLDKKEDVNVADFYRKKIVEDENVKKIKRSSAPKLLV